MTPALCGRVSVLVAALAVGLGGCATTQTQTSAPSQASTSTSASAEAVGGFGPSSPEDQAALVTALEQNGCVLGADSNFTILQASGLDVGSFLPAVQALSARGLLETVAPKTFRLATPACSG